LPANITNEEVKKKYEIQTKVLRRGLDIRFTRGNTDEEQKMVKVLKVLIIGEDLMITTRKARLLTAQNLSRVKK